MLQILLGFKDSTPIITVGSIAEQFDISVPSAYRYISLLRELYLIEERGRGTYSLTPQVFRLASVAESSLDIGTLGTPVVNRLVDETGETVLILRRIEDSAVCVASATPDNLAMISFKPGHLMPIHRGAGPKILFGTSPADKRERYLHKLETQLGSEAIEKLRDELALIAKQGYAVSSAEVDEGVYAVAAPIEVEGRTLATLSIASLEFRLSDGDRETLLETVTQGADEIADLLLAKEYGSAGAVL